MSFKFNFKQYKPVNVVFRAATPIDEFHFDECSPAHSKKKAVVVSNPLYVIFNAKRLESVGQFNIDEWIDSMNNSSSSSLTELRKQISDEDLISYMKSRYCQKPSELQSWFAYLSNNMDNFTSEVREYVKKMETPSPSDESNNE